MNCSDRHVVMLLVIVDDLYVRGSRLSVNTFKANPPLIVDADTVLTLPIAAQCLEPVAGRLVGRSSLRGGEALLAIASQ